MVNTNAARLMSQVMVNGDRPLMDGKGHIVTPGPGAEGLLTEPRRNENRVLLSKNTPEQTKLIENFYHVITHHLADRTGVFCSAQDFLLQYSPTEHDHIEKQTRSLNKNWQEMRAVCDFLAQPQRPLSQYPVSGQDVEYLKTTFPTSTVADLSQALSNRGINLEGLVSNISSLLDANTPETVKASQEPLSQAFHLGMRDQLLSLSSRAIAK